MQKFRVTTATAKGILTVDVLNKSRAGAVRAAMQAHLAKTQEPRSIHIKINGVEVLDTNVALIR